MLFRTQNIFVGSATPALCRSVSRPGRPEEEEKARKIKQACKRFHRQSPEKSKKEKEKGMMTGRGLSGECHHNFSCKNQGVAASYPSGGQESQTHPTSVEQPRKNKCNRKGEKKTYSRQQFAETATSLGARWKYKQRKTTAFSPLGASHTPTGILNAGSRCQLWQGRKQTVLKKNLAFRKHNSHRLKRPMKMETKNKEGKR